MEKSDIDKQRNTWANGNGDETHFQRLSSYPRKERLVITLLPRPGQLLLDTAEEVEKTLKIPKKTSPPRVCKVESLVREVNFFLRAVMS